MTAPELYLSLCNEAGTYDDPKLDADGWWDASSHNIQGIEDDLLLAAAGDLQALALVRIACGLSPVK